MALPSPHNVVMLYKAIMHPLPSCHDDGTWNRPCGRPRHLLFPSIMQEQSRQPHALFVPIPSFHQLSSAALQQTSNPTLLSVPPPSVLHTGTHEAYYSDGRAGLAKERTRPKGRKAKKEAKEESDKNACHDMSHT
ncbi:hypothetical protein ACLOJK_008859 [Asimina triloba]